MPAAHDAASSATGTGVTSLTWSHTCTGSNRCLVVGTEFLDSTADVTGITYAGAALTKVGEASQATAEVHQWRRIAPATGANNIVASFAAATDVAAGAESATGVDQTTPLGTQATATGTSTAPSVNVSAATGDLVVDTVVFGDDPTVTGGAGQTTRWSSAGPNVAGGGSTEAGAATVTMDRSLDTSQAWAIAGVAFKAAAAAVTVPPPFPPPKLVVG